MNNLPWNLHCLKAMGVIAFLSVFAILTDLPGVHAWQTGPTQKPKAHPSETMTTTNLLSRDNGHMDKVVYNFLDTDYFTSRWTWYQDGKEQWMEEIKYERAVPVEGQKSGNEQPTARKVIQMPKNELLKKLIGRWEGDCRTWFEPGKLADESRVAGEFVSVLDGRFVRHLYTGTIQGKPRHGEELIALNSMTKSFQISWIDDFHMNYAIMFSQGEATARGFSVRGDYDVGNGQPKWGWRTEFELIDDNQLVITAYNITPDGEEAKAVETRYRRIK